MTADEAAADLIRAEATNHRGPWNLWTTNLPATLSAQLGIPRSDAVEALRRTALAEMGGTIQQRKGTTALRAGGGKLASDHVEMIVIPGAAA